MNHPLPSKPGGAAGPSTQQSYQTSSPFTNSQGYGAVVRSNHSQQQPNQPYQPPALVNPYAPHINYNIPIQSAGFSGDAGSSSSGPYIGLNGVGTSGPHGCNHPGCKYRGGQKEVEVHRMDRHLIFPPGWVDRKRKRRDDGGDDIADEEQAAKLAGVTTVPGTTVVLDSPDAIAAWIAERRKRYPTANRIEEKGKQLQEAIDRGQIVTPTDRRRKAQPNESSRGRGRDRGRGRGQPRGRGRGRGRGGSVLGESSHQPADPSIASRSQDNGWQSRGPGRKEDLTNILNAPKGVHPRETSSTLALGYESGSDSGSGSDIDPVQDAISSKPPVNYVETGEGNTMEEDDNHTMTLDSMRPTSDIEMLDPHLDQPKSVDPRKVLQPPRRKPAPRPKPPPRAPFRNRPSLLQNLLLPDIRTTVSNLSQAIRFLVANDFLENVELKPGEAEHPMIAVINEDVAQSHMVDHSVPEASGPVEGV